MKKLLLLLLTFGLFMSCESNEMELTQQELLIGEWIELGTDNLTKYRVDGIFETGNIADGYFRSGWYTLNGNTIVIGDRIELNFVIDRGILYMGDKTFSKIN
jgi:hypothetical protein